MSVRSTRLVPSAAVAAGVVAAAVLQAAHAGPVVKVGNIDLPAAADPARITGAKVDESKVQQVVYVDAGAVTEGDGTQARPFRTAAAGLDKAAQLIKQGIGTKLLLQPGVYRERNLRLDGKALGGQAFDTVLVIEGAKKGEVLFRGSITEGFEPATWTLVDAAKKLYKHDWPHNWGAIAKGYYKPAAVITQRREMVFVNDQALTQVLTEDIEFRLPTSEEFDEFGLKRPDPKKKGASAKTEGFAYFYKGYKGPGALKPGEFGVNELGPGEKINTVAYDGHPDPNTIFLRLPEGMASLDGAKIEIALSLDNPDTALSVKNKANLVIRNIVWERYGNRYNHAIFGTHAYEEHLAVQSHDWLIEDCAWRWNNGSTFNIAWVQNVTIRRCEVNDNGGTGCGLNYPRNVLIEDVQMNRNAWRNAQGDFHNHAAGGISWMGKDLLFRRVQASHNGTGKGCRGDITGINVIFEDCQFNDNAGLNGGGLFLEIMTGPFLLKNCDLSGNANAGVLLLCSYNVTLENCRLVDNQGPGITFNSTRGRNTQDSYSPVFRTSVPIPGIRNFQMVGSVIASSRGAKAMAFGGSLEDAGAYRTELTLSGNRYFNKDNPQFFQVMGKPVDLSAWQKATGEKDATWGPPPAQAR